MKLHNYRYYGIGVFLLTIFGLWGFSLAGFLELPDGYLYQGLVRLAPVRNTPAQVLLVETDRGQADGKVYGELLGQLQGLGAERVVFTTLPATGGEDFLNSVVDRSKVILGRQWLQRDDAAGPTLEPWPGQFAGLEPRSGIVARPPAAFGLYRRQHALLPVGGEDLPALERLVAAEAGVRSLPNSPYLIDFTGGANRLPLVSADRVLAGGLIAELVKGRHVLVGAGAGNLEARYYTPAPSPKGEITLLQYQGFALDSLLRGAVVTPAGPLLKLLAVLAIALLCLFLYQNVSCRLAGGLTLLLLGLYLAVAWVLLSFAGVWIPVTEMILTHLTLFPLLFTRRAEVENLILQESLLGTSARLQERVSPPSIFQSQDYWAQVVALVNQSLDLNRLIFLERIPREHRLREIKAMNCSLEDIQERRRDYLRSPYSTAINQKGPVKLDKDYLARTEAQEDVYLVPLTFAGEVLGFWAFGVDAAKRKGLPLFDEAVLAFAEEIGELLYQRQQWLARQQVEENNLARYLLLEGGPGAHRHLQTSLALLDKRLATLENIFEGLDTATILYDLFGRVLQVNRVMSQLLQEAGLAPFEMTALDFVVAVTGREVTEMRQLLEKIVLEHSSATLQGSLPADRGRSCLLKIRPLKAASGAAESHPFRLQGLLCELVDLSALDRLEEGKERLLHNFVKTLQTHLEGVDGSLSSWDGDDLSPGTAELKARLSRQSKEALSALERVQALLSGQVDDSLVRHSPASPQRVVEWAVDKVERLAGEREITFRVEIPDPAPPLFAPQEELLEVLEAILTYLLQDAAQGSEIVIRFALEGQIPGFSLSNQGFGLPAERFQEYLFGHDPVSSPEFRRLRRALRLAQRWGSVIEGSSEVGRGTQMTLRLRGFI